MADVREELREVFRMLRKKVNPNVALGRHTCEGNILLASDDSADIGGEL